MQRQKVNGYLTCLVNIDLFTIRRPLLNTNNVTGFLFNFFRYIEVANKRYIDIPNKIDVCYFCISTIYRSLDTSNMILVTYTSIF